MKFALVNPLWSFEHSIYFGCREPHLPLEFGYSKRVLEAAGHEAIIIDATLDDLDFPEVRKRLKDFRPDCTVFTTAPSYLFWRCAPPELRVPQLWIHELREVTSIRIAVGPHASTTPGATLKKLDVDAVVLGECEEILPDLCGDWSKNPAIRSRGDRVTGAVPHASDMTALPALSWTPEIIQRHLHHHHRFDAVPTGPGAEMEASRGCPYHCTFCAKDNFRNDYRKRPRSVILAELDQLLQNGVEYVYFIDEIFLPDRQLLEEFTQRRFKFGIQTRIDLWKEDMLELLGRSGCVSVEAGVESISEEGRAYLDKKCRLSTSSLSERLIYAKKFIPFVQGNLIQVDHDSKLEIESWRSRLQAHGVWANEPVPLFPYPGSPDYTRLWGAVDDYAWERAHEYYLSKHRSFSDIQDGQPFPLVQLELSSASDK